MQCNTNQDILEVYNSLLNKKVSLIDFYNHFSSEDDCLDLYFRLRFSGQNCKKCSRSITENYKRVYRADKNGTPKKAYKCRTCKSYIYPMSDSVFKQSSIDLPSIFISIFTFCLRKSGISADYLTSLVNISYKSAHRLLMLIRSLLCDFDDSKMSGEIEIDEAFFGSNTKYDAIGITTRKKPVIGMKQREPRYVRLFLVNNRNARTINKLIEGNIEKGSLIYTDSWKGYDCIPSTYTHKSVDHSSGEYVRGKVHTNGIENFWRHFKRSLRGQNIKISDQYVQLYANEAAWRYNSISKSPIQLFNEILVRSMLCDSHHAKSLIKPFHRSQVPVVEAPLDFSAVQG